MIRMVHSYGYFSELSCRFGVVRVTFGIPKRGSFAFLGGDV